MTPRLSPADTEKALRTLLLPEEIADDEVVYGAWAQLARRLSGPSADARSVTVMLSRVRRTGATVGQLVAWGAIRVT